MRALTAWITTNWKILYEMGIPGRLTCLLRNLYSGQDETIRTRHGTTYRFLRRQLRWSGNPISLRISHNLLWSSQSKALPKQKFFWNSFASSMFQRTLTMPSLVSLPLQNPACTSGSSQFRRCWSLAWRILSTTLLTCEMSAIVQ